MALPFPAAFIIKIMLGIVRIPNHRTDEKKTFTTETRRTRRRTLVFLSVLCASVVKLV